MLRSAARVVVISRCVRGIDARGLHKTNLAALRDALIGVTRDVARRGAVPVRRLLGRRVRAPAARDRRRRRDQRRDRRRVDRRQGHARPLHAPRRRASTPAGASPSTSATRRPCIARRSCARASRRCTACPSSRSPTSSSRSRAGRARQKRVLDVTRGADGACAGRVDHHADRVEADRLRREGAARARRAATRRRGGACAARWRGPRPLQRICVDRATAARPRGTRRVLTSTNTSARRRARSGRSRRARVRTLRASIDAAAAAQVLGGELLAAAAERAARVGAARWAARRVAAGGSGHMHSKLRSGLGCPVSVAGAPRLRSAASVSWRARRCSVTARAARDLPQRPPGRRHRGTRSGSAKRSEQRRVAVRRAPGGRWRGTSIEDRESPAGADAPP